MLKLIAALVASALILSFSMEVRRASERSYSSAQNYAATDKRHRPTSNAVEEETEGPLARYTYWLTFFTGIPARRRHSGSKT
jgi:hypothetical protein